MHVNQWRLKMEETLKQILMRRDGCDADEAQELIDEARQEAAEYFASDGAEGRDPEEILREDFGLEPDYIFELID
jgi:hypothetical protein